LDIVGQLTKFVGHYFHRGANFQFCAAKFTPAAQLFVGTFCARFVRLHLLDIVGQLSEFVGQYFHQVGGGGNFQFCSVKFSLNNNFSADFLL